MYLADADTDGVTELYRSDLKSGQVLKLNGPIAAGGRVESLAFDAKGRNVVYYADQDTEGVHELYRSVLKTVQRQKLSNTLLSLSPAGTYVVDPKSRYVVYRSDQAIDGVAELYRSDLNTGNQRISDTKPLTCRARLRELLASGHSGPDLTRRGGLRPSTAG